jgi:hypothetical protein
MATVPVPIIGMLIQKIQRQDTSCAKAPPIIGPATLRRGTRGGPMMGAVIIVAVMQNIHRQDASELPPFLPTFERSEAGGLGAYSQDQMKRKENPS